MTPIVKLKHKYGVHRLGVSEHEVHVLSRRRCPVDGPVAIPDLHKVKESNLREQHEALRPDEE